VGRLRVLRSVLVDSIGQTIVSTTFKEISLRGRMVKCPCVNVEDRAVLAHGKLVRMASVHDEVWLEGDGVRDPKDAIGKIKGRLAADIFTFAQKIPDTQPKYAYKMEWDNAAAIPLTGYEDWWEKLPQESRKNVRRSGRRGVVARVAELDDAFIEGIVAIYNETPVRQGKPFPKFGQTFADVKRDMSQLLDRSVFVGAYHGSELIGFVKLVFVGQVASILSINSMNVHFDKRPTNVLIAKTVEIAVARGMTHLIYGRYVYGNKAASPLTEFKRRNGFVQIDLPRYYIPLNMRGQLTLALNLHRGLVGILPDRVLAILLNIRSWIFQTLLRRRNQAQDASKAREDAEGGERLEVSERMESSRV
jgi:hypothetical protein